MGILSENLSTYKSVEKRADLIISEKEIKKRMDEVNLSLNSTVQRHVEEQVTGDLLMGEMGNDIQFDLDYMFTSFRLWNGLLKVEL